MDLHVYRRQEDLPMALQEHVVHYDGHVFPDWFKHPLYVSMMPLVSPKPIEEMISIREEMLDKYLAVDDYAGYVFGHERAFRVSALRDVTDSMNHDGVREAHDFWKLTAAVWVDCEEDECSHVWRDMIEAAVPHRGFMMGHDDRAKLRSMPDAVPVYRGVQASSMLRATALARAGWQWTTSLKTAKFFARRFLHDGNEPYIIKHTVPKENVIAFLQQRGESEIIVDPNTWDRHWGDGAVVSKIDRKRTDM
jgi:hypothetical protein